MHTHEPGGDVRALWALSHVGAGSAVNSDLPAVAACKILLKDRHPRLENSSLL